MAYCDGEIVASKCRMGQIQGTRVGGEQCEAQAVIHYGIHPRIEVLERIDQTDRGVHGIPFGLFGSSNGQPRVVCRARSQGKQVRVEVCANVCAERMVDPSRI